MLLDANLLIYAFDNTSPFHQSAKTWLTDMLESGRRIGIPIQSLTAFARIVTHPKISETPADPVIAARVIRHWLDVPTVWVPAPGPAHVNFFCGLLERHRPTGNLISDASLAALALEHGLTLCSTDSDFARFPELTWHNPIPHDAEQR